MGKGGKKKYSNESLPKAEETHEEKKAESPAEGSPEQDAQPAYPKEKNAVDHGKVESDLKGHSKFSKFKGEKN